jgi:hypothetical protein
MMMEKQKKSSVLYFLIYISSRSLQKYWDSFLWSNVAEGPRCWPLFAALLLKLLKVGKVAIILLYYIAKLIPNFSSPLTKYMFTLTVVGKKILPIYILYDAFPIEIGRSFIRSLHHSVLLS